MSEPSVNKTTILNGTPINEYTVVHKANDKMTSRLALAIRDMIEDICECKLNVVDDTNAYGGAKEILVGVSARTAGNGPAPEFGAMAKALEDREYVICGNENFVFLGGKEGDRSAVVSASSNFVKLVKADGCADLSDKTVKKAKEASYRVMSYNDGDNSTTRPHQVSAIINDYSPDLIGMQEVQMIHLHIYEATFPGYKTVYFDTNDHYHIGPPILYKAARFELVESGSQFLSDTPDVLFSMYEESDYTRNYIYAIFKDKLTGDKFVAVNTHLDYVESATYKQMKVLIELTRRFKDMPIYYTGDWNTCDDTAPYKMMIDNNFIDSRLIADKREDASTCGDYVIDFLFSSILYTTVEHYRVINKHEFSDTASDHYPILIDLKIIR